MDLLRFHVDSAASGNATVPGEMRPFASLSPTQAKRTRVFTLAMSGMIHTINGQLFSMARVDFTVPFGDVEIWEFRNLGIEPHPMHAHAGFFQVLSRSSTSALPPEDSGWKDTVLVSPGETVRVLTRFDTHSGVFLHHCHNLEHEDAGMMQNFEILPAPAITVRREGSQVNVSWPEVEPEWLLESSPEVEGSVWEPVAKSPAAVDGQWTVTLPEFAGRRFYRLVKR
jgi:hypothetical protein